jgi:hypothetical protein
VEEVSSGEPNVTGFDFGLIPVSLDTGVSMSKRSDLWRQAQVCMSLARATDDPVLKERYVDLAVDLVWNAERESPGDKMSDQGSVERSPQKK